MEASACPRFSSAISSSTGRSPKRKIDFFVNGSLAGLYFGAGYGAAGSLGGGLNYWFRERVGLRTEARFQVLASDEALAVFRVGLSFR